MRKVNMLGEARPIFESSVAWSTVADITKWYMSMSAHKGNLSERIKAKEISRESTRVQNCQVGKVSVGRIPKREPITLIQREVRKLVSFFATNVLNQKFNTLAT